MDKIKLSPEEKSWCIAECLKKLQEYENAEEEGRLLHLPCKIGEKVFCITSGNCAIVEDYIEDYDIWSIKDGTKLRIRLKSFNGYCIAEFGKTVFTTREEAETALAAQQKEGV